MPSKIVLVSPSPEVTPIAREMAPLGFDTHIFDNDNPDYQSELADASYMICYPHVPMGPEFHAQAKHLKLVQLLSAGYDRVDLESARATGRPVCNNGGANAISVA
ncbi:MAG: hypothetical protein AAF709_04530 [Pseudomonadota bacterium]